MKEYPDSSLVTQVGALLKPAYWSMNLMVQLEPYTFESRSALLSVADMMEVLDPSICDGNSLPVKDGSQSESEKPNVHRLLLTGVGASAGQSQSGSDFHNKVMDEYRFYELTTVGGVDVGVLKFWKREGIRLPILIKLAKLVLTCPESPTSSERVFSFEGLIRNRSRARLSPKTTECLVKVGHFLII